MRTVHVRGVDIDIHEREDWQDPAKPVKGPVATPSAVHTVVAHYPGAGLSFKPPTDSAQALRNLQTFALDEKGYSLYYGFYFGPGGLSDIWEIRGFDLRNAANNGDFPPYSTMDNPDWNDSTVSFYVPCSEQFPPTEAQQEAFRYMLAHADEVYGETLALLGHKDSDFTDCPGPLYPMLPALAVRPEEDELASSDEILTAITELRARFDQFAARELARDQASMEREQRIATRLERKPNSTELARGLRMLANQIDPPAG